MGCIGSKRTRGDGFRFNHQDLRKCEEIRKPKPWKHSEPITRTQLKQMRDEFWDTAPHYGGQRGVIVQNDDLTILLRRKRYELPKYVLSEPINMIHEN
ncbi:ubiquitin domain-containing protein 1 [Gossypium australe]|uniref:Ubiquitin domain-containing protein 1 n=1 Tax=Gossypium australe TaxID=47621 RepID=A0A5B6XA95_9ROSI|nr:ubiquitin domain-containing protein 1 [Gossypium australe]